MIITNQDHNLHYLHGTAINDDGNFVAPIADVVEDMFAEGQYFPHPSHAQRIKRYKDNKKLFKGKHFDVFERVNNRLSASQRDIVYLSSNLAGLICKKSADFLFGENATFSAGTTDDSNEQKAIERFVRANDLNIMNYEAALGAAYRGDAFYKIRWGQRYGGLLPASADPFRIFIEHQNAEYVFPQTMAGDSKRVLAYHIAVPEYVETRDGQQWYLNTESHYPGRIIFRKFRMATVTMGMDNEVLEWRITEEIPDYYKETSTGVPLQLVVHIPNFALDDSWKGVDDLSELKPLLDELNNRLSLMAVILDKHSDPAIALPAGSLSEDANGNPLFHVARDKVFEIMDKNEIIPTYITWNGELTAAFEQVKLLVDQILTIAEIPPVALGKDNSGTSGASGLSIKFRMASILSKTNRKRQYFDKGLKQVLLIAQMLEASKVETDYKLVPEPFIKFNDGLPNDDMEQAQLYSLRLGGKSTVSQLTAIMHLDNLTEEQAQAELDRINKEEEAAMKVDASIFNKQGTNGGS